MSSQTYIRLSSFGGYLKALIIGMGSIGQRHARLLAQKNFKIEVLSRSYSGTEYKTYRGIDEIQDFESYRFVLIASETAKHSSDLKRLRARGFTGHVLIEKPIFYRSDFAQENNLALEKVFVAYQLRFHPILQEIKNLIQAKKIHSVSLRVGQHLSSWRTNRPWKESYSALREQGGGVLRDLSHEIDYAQWLIGDLDRVVGLIKKTSELVMDTEDIVSFFGVFKNETVLNVEMNYLDRLPSRLVHILGEGFHLKGDLISGDLEFKDDQGSWKKSFPADRDLVFSKMYDEFLGAGKDQLKDLCTSQDALKVLKVCEAVEASWEGQKWQKI